MSEEEKDEVTQTDADAPTAGTDASAAGPVAEEDSSSSQAAGEEPTSAPPAEEAPEPEEPQPQPDADPDTPGREAEEVSGSDSEEVSGSDSAADPDSDLPWKERRRLERSRQPTETKPQRSPDERAAERAEARRTEASARRRYRGSKRGESEPHTGTPPAEKHPNPAKTRQGVVVSDKGEKTITVRIDIARRHPTYEKVVRRSRTLHAHDERNEAGEGDIVRVIETRPLSRTKRWRLVEVIEKAK